MLCNNVSCCCWFCFTKERSFDSIPFISLSKCFLFLTRERYTQFEGTPKTSSTWILFLLIVRFFIKLSNNRKSCKHSLYTSVSAVYNGTSCVKPYWQIAFASLLSVLTFANFIWIKRFMDKGFTTDTITLFLCKNCANL